MGSTVIVPQSHSSCQVLYGSQSLYRKAHHSHLIWVLSYSVILFPFILYQTELVLIYMVLYSNQFPPDVLNPLFLCVSAYCTLENTTWNLIERLEIETSFQLSGHCLINDRQSVISKNSVGLSFALYANTRSHAEKFTEAFVYSSSFSNSEAHEV